MRFRSECAITHPPRQAACIVSRRHEMRGQLGVVAAVGAGFVRAIGSEGAGNGQFQSPLGGVAFDGEGNLVVFDGWNHRIQVFRHIDGGHLRTIGCRGAGNGQFYRRWGIAFDGASLPLPLSLPLPPPYFLSVPPTLPNNKKHCTRAN
jgi:hypothetical protein